MTTDHPEDHRLSRVTGSGPGPFHEAPVPAAAVGTARPVWQRLAFLVVGLGVFITALDLMRAGARALIPDLAGSIFTDNAWSALGLGWMGACLVLSGSPIAASSLTLLDGGAIDRSQAFAMLTGSRLGASFVVLVIGAIYAMRRRAGRRAPLSIGVYSLTMTAFAYLPGALIGWLLLTGGHLDGVDLAASPDFVSVTDQAFGWAAELVEEHLPSWTLFPAGLAVLLVAFRFVDLCLPQVRSDRLQDRTSLLGRPWAMFGLGCLVALMTLSVSVALTILVPLVANGYLKREDTLPYIAGANITTLADTLVVAIVLGNADAVRVVLAELIGVGAFTLVALALIYPAIRRSAVSLAQIVLGDRARLGAFVAVLFAVPVTLIAV